MDNFDLNVLDAKSAAEAGAVIQLDDPRTEEPLFDADGAPVTITLLGMDSEKVSAITRRTADRRLERIQKQRNTELDTETLFRERVAMLAAATVAWNLIPIDGVMLDCTEANARKLYSDPRFPWIVEQLGKAIEDRKRFFKNRSTR